MGIALLGLAGLFSPLRAVAHRWPARRARTPLRPDSAARPSCSAGAALKVRPAKPLRVVRLVDAQDRHGKSGRIVISGRLADVCVELERLAALEGADPPAGTPRAP
ncbi:MAG: hypothetical protein JWQ03_1956 [Variovorax sp.]|nr:hypothetical protein [Variovorax sp.]